MLPGGIFIGMAELCRPWAGSTPAHLPLPLFALLPKIYSHASQYGLSVPRCRVGAFSKARKHSLGPGNDLGSDGSTAFAEHGALQGAQISHSPGGIAVMSFGIPGLLSLPKAGSLCTVPLESTLHSESLMFQHFCLVWKNCFHYFLFPLGMWWTWSINSKASSNSCECFCSLETCSYFIPIGEMLTFIFKTSQNTAILTFGKHHYVKILHCRVKKINLSIFLMPQSLNFIT